MKNIFSSPRFWLIVIIAVLQSLSVFNILGGDQVDQLTNIISIALGGIVAIRTIDKQGESKILAAGVTSGQVSTKSVTDVPPQG